MKNFFQRAWAWLMGTGFEFRLEPPRSPASQLAAFLHEVARQRDTGSVYIVVTEDSFPEFDSKVWRSEAYEFATRILFEVDWCDVRFIPPGPHNDGWLFVATRRST